MYTIAFVDRTNVSLALPEMSRDLKMDATQAGAASGVFFVGYVLLQMPFGYLASRWSPKALVACMLLVWGVCSSATGFVRSWPELMTARFALGLAEGGVWPATLVLLSRWFPRSERARANAYWMLCLPCAVVISSPISGWILAHWNWRVLLISEGILPLVWLIIWMARIDDSPSDANWIGTEERQYLEDQLRVESLQETHVVSRLRFADSQFFRQVFLMAVISFFVSAGNYGYLFWLPSVLQSSFRMAAGPKHEIIGVLNAAPYLFASLAMIAIAKSSDRRKERRWHTALALGWAGTCLIAGSLIASRSPIAAFCLLCLLAGGSFGMLGPFWSIPTETLPAELAGLGIGMIQFSNLGGAFGPTLIGYLDRVTKSYTGAFVFLGIGWLIAALLCLPLNRART